MEYFIERDQQFRQHTPDTFHRFIFKQWNPDVSFTLIPGPPATGKSTLLRQLAEHHPQTDPNKSLFISASFLWLHRQSLFDLAESFYLNGGRYLLVDDLHTIPEWESEILNIGTRLPELHVVATTACELPFTKESNIQPDVRTLPGLSFREYLAFREAIKIDAKKLGEIVSFHKEFSEGISGLFQPIPPFRRYLAGGSTFSNRSTGNLPGTLAAEQKLNHVLETDLPSVKGVDIRSVFKIKQLLGLILSQIPFKPNISEMARSLDVSRDSVYLWLSYLQEFGLINMLWKQSEGHIRHRKPEFILPGNTSMLYLGGETPAPQSLRLTFLVNQLHNAGFTCTIPGEGMLYLNGLTLNVGDKHQPPPNVSDGSHPLVAADNTETGTENKIPLWMFGLLY